MGAMIALAGCETLPQPEVTRFHLNQPIPPGTVYVEPRDLSMRDSLEFRDIGGRVSDAWARLGFRPVSNRSEAEYVSQVAVESSFQPTRRESPVHVGVGGGGFGGGRGGGFGLGAGVSFPVGRPRTTGISFNQISVTLMRQSDRSAVWEGRSAVSASSGPGGSLSAIEQTLIDGLFSDFPGRSGTTVRYKPKA